MATHCGHLYCLDCATYNFATANASCAICRRPQTLDDLIKLYPDYEREPARPPSPLADARIADIGTSVLDACYEVLQSDDEFDDETLGSALSKTDDLLEALSNCETCPSSTRRLLAAIVSVLSEIRAKLSETTSRIPELQRDRDRLLEIARTLKDKLKLCIRDRQAERASANEQLQDLRTEWSDRVSALQDRLQELSALLAAERAKAEASTTSCEKLEAEKKQWRLYANRYKKKYYALRKEHEAVRSGIDDVFFPDDSLEVI
ncbi:uncharacterized protein FIBRA_06590 [Fibroporia radiculosa]|uniref:RING-type domain-containing protein n=1 Tax=Fibroporia radiculosa TaxID=599839 RepID=J4GBZ4_9APHY|nr:uncharacterized protein FIBRA_06590 [Fibroporia radiculosa]CCM04413.1 predicted protein [Fibroporia radiculosa]